MAKVTTDPFAEGFKEGLKEAKHKAAVRKRLMAEISQLTSKQGESVKAFSRQVAYDDFYETHYETKLVLKPPYSPERMYELYEECGCLQACVDAFIFNVGGYGWKIKPKDGSEVDNLPPAEKYEAHPEKVKLENLFDCPNGQESFSALREFVDRDYNVTGNGYIEVVRNLKGEPALLFWLDAKRMRLTPLDDEHTTIVLNVSRDGKDIKIPSRKRFRKYVMGISNPKAVTGTLGKDVRFFKEFGDPRNINAFTGHTEDKKDNSDEVWESATEVIHFKYGNGTYGIPRWIGTLLNVMGITKADYINHNLFEAQGIPPLLITIAGGELTEESMNDLLAMLKGHTEDIGKFNKPLLLEASGTSFNLQGKDTPPKLNVTSLTEYRKDDLTFQKYLEDSRAAIRSFGFRLPAMFLGEHTGLNYASANLLRIATEDQVFIPARNKFDDVINNTIVKDLGVSDWVFDTVDPVIKSNADLMGLLPHIVNTGVLSPNELIEFFNENFNAQLRPYVGEHEEWADSPLAFSKSLYNYGTIYGQGEGDPQNPQGQEPVVGDGEDEATKPKTSEGTDGKAA